MPIHVERPKDLRGRRAKCFNAYSRSELDAADLIVEGNPGESASDVKARAVDALLRVFESASVDARSVVDTDGRVECWIMAGDPHRGYRYGRVYSRGGDNGLQAVTGQPEWHSCSMMPLATREQALRTMLAHMADNHAPSTWPQFLFGLHETVLESIRKDIADRNAARARMVNEATP